MSEFQDSLTPSQASELRRYQRIALVLTFLSYVCFHMVRKVYSIVKTPLTDPEHGWPTFIAEGPEQGKFLLGTLDSCFLAAYAVGMMITGHLGDRMDLRLWLTFGMIMSALTASLWGFAFVWDIRSYGWFLFANVFAGFFQSIGWPSVVSVMSVWFEKDSRGLVMGIWNSNSSVGNIMGSVLATAALQFGWFGVANQDWPMSFFLTSLLMFLVGVMVFKYLVPHPNQVGLPSPAEFVPQKLRSFRQPVETLSAGKPFLVTASRPGFTTDLELEELRWDSRTQSPSPGSTDFRGLAEAAATADAQNPQSELDVIHVRREELREMEERLTSQQTKGSPISVGSSPHGVAAGSGSDGTVPRGVGFMDALRIPGVVEYSVGLFFAKLVAYTFLFWLPNYLAGVGLSTEKAGYLSSFFDVGGIVGGVIAGWLSDRLGKRGIVNSAFLVFAIPMLGIFRIATADSPGDVTCILLMLILGFFVNGPYALITTAVSADLGSHESLKGNAQALGAVTGIIDGTGSAGAAVVGLIGGQVSNNQLFLLLMLSCLVSMLCLWRITKRDWYELLESGVLDSADALYRTLFPDREWKRRRQDALREKTLLRDDIA